MRSETNLKISLVMVVLLVGIHCSIAVGTEPYVIVDDMEGYNDRSEMRDVWTDGYHNVVWGTDDYTVLQGGSSGSNLNVSSEVGGYGPGGIGPIPPTPLNYEAMVLRYDNDGYTYTGLPGREKWVYDAPYYSEIEANTVGTNSLGVGQDWSGEGFTSLSMLFQGHPLSDGYLDVSAWPKHTIYSRGRDIQGRYDEFYYLSQYPLTGPGYVEVHVLTMDSTDPLAKAGLMIREKSTPYSKHASVFITPSSGITFSFRNSEDGPTISITKPGITAPQYLRLERIINGEFRAYHSGNAFIWHYVNAPGSDPVFPIIPMGTVSDPGIYIGSMVTSGNSSQICSADFDKLNIIPPLPWFFGNIGTNDPEQLYVALEDSAGNVGVVSHNDINAATRTTWQKWNIPLTEFTGVNLNSVKKIYIGLGDRNAPVQGGSGALYIDDIRLYKQRGALFVDADAPAGGNGSSWANAYNDLQDALATAVAGDEIRVAQGVYKPAGYIQQPPPPPPPPPPPMTDSNEQETVETTDDREDTFQLKSGVIIKGGYAGAGEPDPNARDIKMYETILSGDLAGNDGPDFTNNDENCYHVVTGSGTDATAILDGFTITAGNANAPSYEDTNSQGGGMFNDAGSPTLTNCMFVGNAARWDGGGMYNSFCNSLLTNCTFQGNSAGTPSGGHGGGIYNYRSNPMLTNCTFSGNWAGQGGGMSNICYSSPTISRCMFSKNSANFGAGMGAKDCSGIILTRCTFSGNSAGGRGGGAEYINSSPTLTSCIFVENSAASRYGGGISIMSNSTPTVTNCTFVANSAPEGRALACDSSSQRPSDLWVTNSILWDGGDEIVNKDDSTITVIYSDVQGGWPGAGNINADPRFIEPGYFGPIAYWRLDEAGGTTAYDSVGQNHGTVYGAQWTTGQIDGALDFDGMDDYMDDYVDIPDFPGLNSQLYTAEAWIKTSSTSFYGTFGTILVKGRVFNENYGLYVYESGIVRWQYTSGGVWGDTTKYVFLDSSKVVNDDQFHHIVGTYDGEELKIYIDGSLDSSRNETKVPDKNNFSLRIGRRNNPGDIPWYSAVPFDGIIDEVAIYNRALSDEEILQLYESSGYRLLPVSPCINAGDPDYIAGPNETDLDGKPRVIGGRIDIGAYEFNRIPVADAGPDRIVECACNTADGTKVTLDGSASYDIDGDLLTYTWMGPFVGSPAHGAAPTVTLEPGCPDDYVITLLVNDGTEDSEPDEVTITVVDTTPPDFDLSVSPTMLWPPDHKMYEITPSWTVSDECDASPDVSLVDIVMNEDDNTIGGGHTNEDIQIGEDGSIYLRSERSGTGNDRIYTITYQAVDDCGNATVRSATVSIPHDFKVLARIAAKWLWTNTSGRIPEDLNGDGIVNLADFARFADNWINNYKV